MRPRPPRCSITADHRCSVAERARRAAYRRSMTYETVLYDVSDGVATVTLNRPERLNAWTSRLGAELGDAMATADEDDAVRAVVVTGAGRAFCAGADLSGGEFGGGDAPTAAGVLAVPGAQAGDRGDQRPRRRRRVDVPDDLRRALRGRGRQARLRVRPSGRDPRALVARHRAAGRRVRRRRRAAAVGPHLPRRRGRRARARDEGAAGRRGAPGGDRPGDRHRRQHRSGVGRRRQAAAVGRHGQVRRRDVGDREPAVPPR